MSQAKIEAIQFIQSLPDDITLKDILYHLYVREKIEQGLRSLAAGEVYTQEEVERSVGRWIRKLQNRKER